MVNTLYGTAIPDWLDTEIKKLCEQLPPHEVIALAKADPAIARGFRLTIARAPMLRKRIYQEFARTADDQPHIIEALRATSLSGRLLSHLSSRTIRTHYRELTRYFGVEAFTAATLLDTRPRVRALAETLLSTDTAPTITRTEYESAKKRLSVELLPLISQLAELAETTGANDNPHSHANTSTHPANDGTAAELRAQLQIQKQQQSQLDKYQRQNNKLQQEIAGLKEQLQSASSDRKVLREQLQAERKNRRAAEQEKHELNATFEARIADQLQAANSRLNRSWLTRAEHTQKLQHEQDNSLPERLQQALENQSRQDRQHGNRQMLQQEKAQLQDYLGAVEDALINAINPERSLPALRTEVVARLEQLDAILQPGCELHTELLRELLVRIATAANRQQIESIEQQARYLHSVQLLTDTELDALLKHRSSRMEIAFDKIEMPQSDASGELMARREIAAAKRAVVFIDGHNCLLSVTDIRRRFPTEAQACGPAGRNWLASACDAIFSGQRNVDVSIYFDGSEASVRQSGDNIKVVFSGGSGDQKADRAILQQLAYLEMMEQGATTFVITNDTVLRREAEKFRANTIEADVINDWYLLYKH